MQSHGLFLKFTASILIFIFHFYATPLPLHGFIYSSNSATNSLNYDRVFDLTKINTKHSDFLQSIECYDNVFPKQNIKGENQINVNQFYLPIINDNKIDAHQEELKLYQKDCLRHLEKSRKWAAAEPAIYNGITLTILGTVIAGLCYYDPSSWNFTLLYFVCYSTILLREIAPSVFGYFYPPNLALNNLEEEFCQNQCFIPNQLWKNIIHKFKQSTQIDNVRFIDFALGLKTFWRKTMHQEETNPYANVIRVLHRKLQSFFGDYEESEKLIHPIGGRLSSFIAQLYGANPSPLCLYFSGPPGIGKTHFAKQMKDFFEEQFPGKIAFTHGTITCQEDLEGNAKNPGLLLKIYRDCVNNKDQIGIVLYIDEVSLKDDNLLQAFKRSFNGKETHIPTNYLTFNGTNDIQLPPIPMFIILTNNEMQYEEHNVLQKKR